MAFDRQSDLYSGAQKFRAKRESLQLCDLGQTVQEKYGAIRGWKLGLRNLYEDSTNTARRPESVPNTGAEDKAEGNLVEDRLLIRGEVSAIARDNRNARVDIIRRTLATPTPALRRQQLDKLAHHKTRMFYQGNSPAKRATAGSTDLDRPNSPKCHLLKTLISNSIGKKIMGNTNAATGLE